MSVTGWDDERRVVFQIWDWSADGSGYESEMFVLSQSDETWQVRTMKAMFRAWQRQEIDDSLRTLGMRDIRWHMPEMTGYHQPILSARK